MGYQKSILVKDMRVARQRRDSKWPQHCSSEFTTVNPD